jgi:hypothetical protein
MLRDRLGETMSVKVSYLGQQKQVLPAPPHILDLLLKEKGFPPVLKEANPEELVEYAKSHGLW